jgi:hypothetical protein
MEDESVMSYEVMGTKVIVNPFSAESANPFTAEPATVGQAMSASQAFASAPAATGTTERKSVFDYPPTNDKLQSLAKIRVIKPSTTISSKTRQENQTEQTAKTVAYILFSLVLDNGKEIKINGARIKQMPDAQEPFLSLDGFRVNGRQEGRDPWINIVDLDEEQKAYLVRYAINEMKTWTEDVTNHEMI